MSVHKFLAYLILVARLALHTSFLIPERIYSICTVIKLSKNYHFCLSKYTHTRSSCMPRARERYYLHRGWHNRLLILASTTLRRINTHIFLYLITSKERVERGKVCTHIHTEQAVNNYFFFFFLFNFASLCIM